MKYEIHFDALNINGVVVGSGAFCITTSCELDVDGKEPAFKRMCVEYARLTGIKCSDVRITDMDAPFTILMDTSPLDKAFYEEIKKREVKHEQPIQHI